MGRLFASYAGEWLERQEIVVSGRRVAYVGPVGFLPGRGGKARQLSAPFGSPRFGEVHKHIESTHLTPDFEAQLVLPRGNTWTCEASHEFANVNGTKNTEFWEKARLAARRSRSSSSRIGRATERVGAVGRLLWL